MLLSIPLLLLSIIAAVGLERYRTGLFLLMLAGCVLSYYFISLDPFLHPWDERFHALVGSNIAKHPLRPTLLDKPYLPYDYTYWGFNHVWLHKQPFFLWLIGASVKLFGNTFWAVRLPSALCVLAMLPMVYDTCCQIDSAQGRRWGYWSALLLSGNVYLWNMVSGYMCMDHNDVVFMAMVTGSFWAWVRLEKSKGYKWSFIMGLFIAAAILTKWLTGLLVLEAWGLYHLFYRKDLLQKQTLLRILPAVATAGLLTASWISYCRIHYPLELQHELTLNSRHLTEVIEFHDGPWYLYLDRLQVHYHYLWLLVLPAAVLAWLRRRQIPELLLLLCCIVTVYVFFSLAATKMEGFVLMVLALMCMVLAYPLSSIHPVRPVLKWIMVLVAAGVWVLHFNPALTRERHFPPNDLLEYGRLRNDEIRQQEIYRQVSKSSLDSVDLIIYAKEAVCAMFYTGKTAHGWISPSDIDSLSAHGVRLGYFPSDAAPGDYGLKKMKPLLPTATH